MAAGQEWRNDNDHDPISKSPTIWPCSTQQQLYAERAGRNGCYLIAVVVVGGRDGGVQRALPVEGRGELPSLHAAIATTTMLLST